MDFYYLVACKVLGISGISFFIYAVMSKNTKLIFFFVPAVLLFSSLSHMQIDICGHGSIWINYVFVFLVIFIVNKNKKVKIDLKIIISLLVFFLCAIGASLFFSIDIARSIGRFLTLCLVITVGVYTIPSINNMNPKNSNYSQNLQYFLIGIIFWYAISPILFALFYAHRSLMADLGTSHFFIEWYRIDRLQLNSIGMNAAGLGYGIGAFILYSLIGYILSKSMKRRIFYIFSFFIGSFVLFLTQTRSALLSVIVAFLFWLILEIVNKKRLRRVIWFFSFFSFLSICFYKYIAVFFGRGGKTYSSISDIIYQSRGERWIRLANNLGGSLFHGSGLGNDRGGHIGFTGDNSYLIMMVQVGVLGLLCWVLVLSFVTYNSYVLDRYNFNDNCLFPVFPYMAYILTISIFSDGLAVPTVSLACFFALGVLSQTACTFKKKELYVNKRNRN